MPVVERVRPLLGTFVTIRAEGATNIAVQQIETAVDSAFRTIAAVDRLMSFHRRHSDIGRLNRARPGAVLRVHGWTYQVLCEAMRLWHWSGGMFDCNVGTPLMRSGLLPKMTRNHPRGRSRFGAAVRLHRNHSIRLNTRVALDLGGIAKGFAVDRAVSTLQARGIVQGSVNAGGDLCVFGAQLQPIWARCPDNPSQSRLLGALANGAVATSASYFGEFGQTHDAISAIVHPERERRVPIAGSVSVIARNCLLADALTKIAVLSGRLPPRLANYAQATVVTL